MKVTSHEDLHMHVYDKILLNSWFNEKRFRQKLYRNSKHIFSCSITSSFFTKIVPFMRQCVKM
jgi:hypothetical protein